MSQYLRRASRKAKSTVREIRHSHHFLPKHSSTNSSHSSARFSDIDAEDFPGSDSDWVVAETSNPLFEDDPLAPSEQRSSSDQLVDSGHSLSSSNSDPLSISPDLSHALPPLPHAPTATKPRLTDSQQKKLDELFGGEETVDAEDDFFDELEKDSDVRDPGLPVLNPMDMPSVSHDAENDESIEKDSIPNSHPLLLDPVEVPLVIHHDMHGTPAAAEEEEVLESSGSEVGLLLSQASPSPSPPLSRSPPIPPDHSEPTARDDHLLQTGSNSDSEPPLDSLLVPPPQTGASSDSESPIPDPLTETVETHPHTSFSDATEATPTTGNASLFDDEIERTAEEKVKKKPDSNVLVTERDQKELSNSPSDHSTILLSDVTDHPLGVDDSFFSLPSSLQPERRDKLESSDQADPDLTFSDDFFNKPSPRQFKRPASFHEGVSPSASPRGSPNMKQSKSGKLVPVVPPRPLFTSNSSPSLPKRNVHPAAGNGIENVRNSAAVKDKITPRVLPLEDLPDQGIEEDLTTGERDQVAVAHDSTVSSSDNEYLLTIFLFFTTIVYLYYSLNPFVYLAGFICGFFLFFITIGSAFVWYVQHSEREKDRKRNQDKITELPSLESLPSTIIVDFEKHRELQVCDLV